MIKFFVGVTQFFIALFMATLFLCAFLMALALLDYMLDLDMKQELNNTLGNRHVLKNLRERILALMRDLDTPSWKDKLDTMKPTDNRDKDIEQIKHNFEQDSKD